MGRIHFVWLDIFCISATHFILHFFFFSQLWSEFIESIFVTLAKFCHSHTVTVFMSVVVFFFFGHFKWFLDFPNSNIRWHQTQIRQIVKKEKKNTNEPEFNQTKWSWCGKMFAIASGMCINTWSQSVYPLLLFIVTLLPLLQKVTWLSFKRCSFSIPFTLLCLQRKKYLF